MFEHITHFRNVNDVVRLAGIRFYLVPQVSYIDVEILFFIRIFRSPYPVQQVTVTQGLTGIDRQFTEKFVFAVTQPDFFTFYRYQSPVIVDTQVAGSEFGYTGVEFSGTDLSTQRFYLGE